MSRITDDLIYLNSAQGSLERVAAYMDRQLTGLSDLVSAVEGVVLPQSDIADLGATTNLAASNVTLSTTDTYADAAVKAAIDAAVDALAASAEARLDAIEAKVDALLAALRSAEILV